MLQSSGIAIATVHSVLVVTDIVGNCLVCAIITKHRDMRTPINYLLFNLAVAHILYATFIAPDTFLRLASTHPSGMTGTILCKLITGGNLAWIAGNSSVITLVAIAVERYYAVICPIYSLVNENFREKLKGMLSCSSTSSAGSIRDPLEVTEVCRQNLNSTAETSSLF